MGINSSMQKIISFTQKFSNSLNLNKLLSVDIPGNPLTSFLGIEDGEGIHSLADLKDAVDETGSLLATGANIIACVGMGLDGYTGFIGQMAMGATAVILSITDQIIEAVSLQLQMAINQIVNMVTNIVSALHNLVNSMMMIIESIKNVLNSWRDGVEFDLKLELDKKNCKDMYAAIAGCLLNKFLGPYIDEFKEKTLNAINEYGKEFNDLLYDELADANTFAAYANQEAFLLKKASLQINGLSKQNLLG